MGRGSATSRNVREYNEIGRQQIGIALRKLKKGKPGERME
jgi:hypothetical protein